MALNASTLKGLIKSKVDAINDDNGGISNDAVLQALADAIVEHIKADAAVVIAGGSSAGSYKVK